ncbi:MAG: hypothetical protein V4723_21900 [Pseudomonadota bacterium]
MMVLVFGFTSFLFYWQRDKIGQDDILGPLAFAGVVMAGIGFFTVRRMKKMTIELENSHYSVTGDGIAAESGSGQFIMKASEIRTITMYRTVLAPKTTYFVIAGKGGEAALPPLENADMFAQEIQDVLPTIPLLQKRKLVAVFGS